MTEQCRSKCGKNHKVARGSVHINESKTSSDGQCIQRAWLHIKNIYYEGKNQMGHQTYYRFKCNLEKNVN